MLIGVVNNIIIMIKVRKKLIKLKRSLARHIGGGGGAPGGPEDANDRSSGVVAGFFPCRAGAAAARNDKFT